MTFTHNIQDIILPPRIFPPPQYYKKYLYKMRGYYVVCKYEISIAFDLRRFYGY